MLKLYRNKIVITLLTAFCVFLFATNAASASAHSGRQIAYRTQLGHDLDGDRIPETATIRHCGSLYQISIHFTTGRPKLRLTTYVTEGEAGLSFQTTDVNRDSKDDIVITSATSVRPIAIWLNQGKAKFQRISSWAYGVGRHTGPEYSHVPTHQPEPVGNISVDPLPQATLAVAYVSCGSHLVALLRSEADKLPVACISRQIPPRGPPVRTRV
jgi:hypothetical protein